MVNERDVAEVVGWSLQRALALLSFLPLPNMVAGAPAATNDHEATLTTKASAKDGRVERHKQPELLMASYGHPMGPSIPIHPGCVTPGGAIHCFCTAMYSHPWTCATWWSSLPLHIFLQKRRHISISLILCLTD